MKSRFFSSINNFFKSFVFIPQNESQTLKNEKFPYDFLIEINNIDNELQKATVDHIDCLTNLRSVGTDRAVERMSDIDDQFEQYVETLATRKMTIIGQYTGWLNKQFSAINSSPLKIYDYVPKGLQYRRDQLPQIDEDTVDILLQHFSDTIGLCKIQVKLNDIKPSQNEFDDDKIRAMITNLPQIPHRVFIISGDNYLLDGHHEWGARLQIDDCAIVDCWQITLPIADIVNWIDTTDEIQVKKRDVNGDIVKSLNYAKLIKKNITDRRGKRTVRWVDPNKNQSDQQDDQDDDESNIVDDSLKTFQSKLSSASSNHLRSFLADNEQSDELKKMAANELERRVLLDNDSLLSNDQQKSESIASMINAHMSDVYDEIKNHYEISDDELKALSGQQFNNGFCDQFAEVISKVIGGIQTDTDEYIQQLNKSGIPDPKPHSFVEKDGKFYDFECLQGCDSVDQLPFFNRQLVCHKIDSIKSKGKLKKSIDYDNLAKEYNEWNDGGYKDNSLEYAVFEFLQNNHEDWCRNQQIINNLIKTIRNEAQ